MSTTGDWVKPSESTNDTFRDRLPRPHRRDWSAAGVLLLAVAGLALSWQGWRARIPAIDLVPHYLDAVALIRDGVIPSRGTISGYLAYNPPGPTWLMVPGVLSTGDPRLAELVPAALLYALTLLGIHRIARWAFSRSTAVLAVALYAFSEIGLFVAGTVWPRAPIQAFVVWTVYWLGRWAVHREARALPIALAIWGAGMYVFMEIAPAILLVPVCWYLYRPPVRLAGIAAAALAVGMVWSPYLSYEAAHEYRDIRSMAFRSTVGPETPAVGPPWCAPGLTVVTDDGAVVGPTAARQMAQPVSDDPTGAIASAAYGVLYRVRGAGENAMAGVVGGTSPGPWWSRAALFVAVMISIMAIGLATVAGRSVRPSVPFGAIGIAVGLGLIATAAAAPAVLIALFSSDGALETGTSDTLQALQILLIVCGAMVALAGPAWHAMGRLAAVARANAVHRSAQRFLVYALLVPWTALLVLVEPGRSDRFWWLWPLAAIFLAALVFHVVGTSTRARRAVAAGLTGLFVAVACVTPVTLSRLQSWRSDGWAGHDADAIRAIEDVASRVAPRSEAYIGYHVHFFRGIPSLSKVEPRFKVGAELDLVLLLKHGVRNANECAEGFEPHDEYRIVDEPSRASPLGTYRIAALPDPTFRLVRRVVGTSVFARPPIK